MFIHCSFRRGISTEAAAVGAGLSVLYEYRSEEDDKAHCCVHHRHRARHCWCHRWWKSRSPRLICRGYVRGAGCHCILGYAGKGSTQVSSAHLLSLGSAVGVRLSFSRSVLSRVRDAYGAVAKALKKTLTIHTGVKRFRFGGSVVPATPSASGIHVTSFQIELVNDVYIRKNLYANGVCDRWHEHVPGGSGAHDEGTGGVSSICNEDQGGRSARPRCHDASVARKCRSSRKMFNFHMRLLGLLFYPLVGELPCPLHENLVVAAGVHRATVLIVAS